MIQVATGILLLLYYRPSAGEAYESIQFLMTEVQFGWLVRSIHAWSANLMVFVMFIHLFSALLGKAYRAPRELTWLSGGVLLCLTLAFGFTGYLLPWNELAFFATRVGTEIPGVVPVVGSFLRRLLRGGDDVTGATLTRFYGIHVAVLPAIVTIVLGLHLFLVQKHGMSTSAGRGTGRQGQARDALLSKLFLARSRRLALRARRARRSGGLFSCRARQEGRSISTCADRDQAGMVFHGDVSNPETLAQSYFRFRG